jgi:phenylalanyl-tRNA synthetase beta chain
VLLELGKPIHTFDAAAVGAATGPRQLIVRRAEAGERIETLDHVERELDPDTLVIANPTGPLAIAGIMGGASSEVGDATTDVIVESAIFDPISIRRTGQRYGLRSEASLRFEKGQEYRLARIGADRTARLVVEWAGGAVATGSVDTAPQEPEPGRVAFRPARVNRLLGTSLSPDDQRDLLARVGIEAAPAPSGASIAVSSGPKPLEVPAGEDDALVATIPTWRRDIEIEADLAEEVARIHGYEEIPGILPHTPMPQYRHPPLEVRDAIREVLAGAGLTEVVTHALVSPQIAERFRWESAMPLVDDGSPDGGRIVTVSNPLSIDHSVLRPALVGSILQAVSTNVRHGTDDVTIFEIGKGYGFEPAGGDSSDTVREWWRLAFAGTGAAETASWDRPARPYDLGDAKGAIDLIARRLGIGNVGYERLGGEPLLHPGRGATVRGQRDGRLALAGWVGELQPSIADELELRGASVLVAELDISGLGGGPLPAVVAAAPSRHPAAERDLAVVVAEDRPAGEVEATIQTSGGPLLQSTRLFDVYRGAPLGQHEKSLAFRLTFRAPDRTLAEAEVDAATEAITHAITSAVGGRVRT